MHRLGHQKCDDMVNSAIEIMFLKTVCVRRVHIMTRTIDTHGCTI